MVNKKIEKKRIFLGAHVSFRDKDQLLGTLKDLVFIGAQCGACYIGQSRSYKRNKPIDEQLTIEAHKYAKEHNIDLKDIIAHGPLLLNLANTTNDYVFDSSFNVILEDLKRLKQLGLKYYNIHPGSNKDTEAGINSLIKAIDKLHKLTKGDDTVILIESMMPKGNYIGKNFEELGKIVSGVKDQNRIGVVLDTCHIWDAGYDIRDDLEGVLKELDKYIGKEKVYGLHVNDSMFELGNGKDRHQRIGEGCIGMKGLYEFITHPWFIDLPKALEIPNNPFTLNTDLDEIRKFKEYQE